MLDPVGVLQARGGLRQSADEPGIELPESELVSIWARLDANEQETS